MREKLSIVLLTKNSEHIVGRCLSAVQGLSDDIVILDGASTDKTAQICRRYTNKFYVLRDPENKISGAELRNRAIAKAKYDWIFILDSDEIVSPELKHEIATIFEKGPEHDGYYVKRRDYAFLDTYIATTEILRIYRKSKGKFKHIIHERVYVDGPTTTLKNVMYHYSYKDVSDYFDRFNKYTTLEARKLYEMDPNKGNLSILMNAVFRPVPEFFLWYFGKGMWKRGLVAFFCACCSSFYQFVKYLKYYELKRERSRRQ